MELRVGMTYNVKTEFQLKPGDPPDLIARRVLPMLFELDAEAPGPATVDSRNDSLDHPARSQVEIGKPREDQRIKIVLLPVSHSVSSYLKSPTATIGPLI